MLPRRGLPAAAGPAQPAIATGDARWRLQRAGLRPLAAPGATLGQVLGGFFEAFLAAAALQPGPGAGRGRTARRGAGRRGFARTA